MVKQIKTATREGITFGTQLLRLVVAAAFLYLGITGFWQGKHQLTLAVTSIALIFSGSIVLLTGIYLLYKILTRKDI